MVMVNEPETVYVINSLAWSLVGFLCGTVAERPVKIILERYNIRLFAPRDRPPE